MKITTMMIGFVLMSLVMISMSLYYADIQDMYAPENSTELTKFTVFNYTFGNFSYIMGRAENQTIGTNKNVITQFADSVLYMFTVAGTILSIPNIMVVTIGNAFGMTLYIPRWIQNAIFLIITIIFVMRIVSIFMKTEEV